MEEAGRASRAHWLLRAGAPLCVPGVASVVIVPVVRRPLALVLIVLVPLLGILGVGGRETKNTRLSIIQTHIGILPWSRSCQGSDMGPSKNQGNLEEQVTDLLPNVWS